MISSPSRLLPRPVVAGIGFASTIPAILAELPAKLPGVAITSVIEARARYLEYLRAGEAILDGGDGSDETADETATFVPEDDPLARAAADRQGPVPDAVSAADLPIENYEGLTLASIRARLPRLDAIDIETLRDYERAHGKRLPVLTMLENRLTKLARADDAPNG